MRYLRKIRIAVNIEGLKKKIPQQMYTFVFNMYLYIYSFARLFACLFVCLFIYLLTNLYKLVHYYDFAIYDII